MFSILYISFYVSYHQNYPYIFVFCNDLKWDVTVYVIKILGSILLLSKEDTEVILQSKKALLYKKRTSLERNRERTSLM